MLHNFRKKNLEHSKYKYAMQKENLKEEYQL